jgi:ribosomal protein S18 acetylase RimI-like enzyme
VSAARRAGPEDAAAIVELRAAMYRALGDDPGPPDAPWRAAALTWFTRNLASGERTAVFVVDGPDGRPVSCAMGLLEARAPSPTNPSGLRGHVSQVSTADAYRRRGYARACLTALLAWFEADTDSRIIDLHASGEGEALYRALGFRDAPFPALRFTRPTA